jgi:hypothetical protein
MSHSITSVLQKEFATHLFLEEKSPATIEKYTRDVRCVSVSPNGDILNGNVYRQDIMEIINKYSI